ncbi:hypothetical protein GA0115240_17563 [Streptomyces sp. DvalAA-14]|nr:hypothetical protein GA0115240_17563 [Streptomyces sp. DvalAA-14]
MATGTPSAFGRTVVKIPTGANRKRPGMHQS